MRIAITIIALFLTLEGCGNGGGVSDAESDMDTNDGQDHQEEAQPADMDVVPDRDSEQDDMGEEEALPWCGDGAIDPGESCDDGNDIPGDGCEIDCKYTCTLASQAEDCDDRLACTDDLCNEGTHTCSYPVDEGSCLISGTCFGAGDMNPDNLCQECSATIDQIAWTERAIHKIGSDVTVTDASGNASVPSIAWTGSEFGVSWGDRRSMDRDIYFARIDSTGTKIGSDIRITDDPGDSTRPSLAWTGSEFGATWSDTRDANQEVYLARIDATGTKIGNDTRISNASGNSIYSCLVWTGAEFGVAWQDARDGNDEIYFARIDSAGSKIGSDVRITSDPGHSYEPSLVWTGDEFGVAWSDDRDDNAEIYFSRIDAAGTKIGSDIRITDDPESSTSASLAWTGSEFGVAWVDCPSSNWMILLSRISSSGVKIGSDYAITNGSSTAGGPSLAWTGVEFGAAWFDYRDGNYEIYFARIDASGSKIGSETRITNDGKDSWDISLAWASSDFGVVWTDAGAEDYIFFARIGCAP